VSWSAKPYRGAPADYEFELATTAPDGERAQAHVDKAAEACRSLVQTLGDAELVSVSAGGHSNEKAVGDSISIVVATLAKT
jgi:catalase (peroxidase I)